jgi:hypothetical protein
MCAFSTIGIVLRDLVRQHETMLGWMTHSSRTGINVGMHRGWYGVLEGSWFAAGIEQEFDQHVLHL